MSDQLIEMMVEANGKLGNLEGGVNAIHRRLDSIDKRHEALQTSIHKNTKFRFYVSGFVGATLMFMGWMGIQIEVVKNKLQALLGQ